MDVLMREVMTRVEEMNEIMRTTTGQSISDDDRIVQFTLFTGCGDGKNGPMMQFIHLDSDDTPSDEHGEFWFADLVPGGGDLGGCQKAPN